MSRLGNSAVQISSVSRHYLLSSLIIAFFIVTSWSYLDYNNIVILLKQASVIGIGILGAAVIALCDGVLLSCGAQIAFTGFLLATLHSRGVPLWLAVLCSFVLAGVAGAAVGGFAHYSNVPILILSLGFDIFLSGYNNVIAQSLGEYPLAQLQWLVNDGLAGISWSLLLFVLLVILYTIVDHYSTWGRALHAVGENEETARNTGLPTLRLKLTAYVVGFLLLNLCGLVMAARVTIPRTVIYYEYSYNIVCVLCMVGIGLRKGTGSFIAILPGTVALVLIPAFISLHNLVWISPSLVNGAIITTAILCEAHRQNRQSVLISPRI